MSSQTHLDKKGSTTIQVTQEVRKELRKIAAILEGKDGESKTYNDAITYLLSRILTSTGETTTYNDAIEALITHWRKTRAEEG